MPLTAVTFYNVGWGEPNAVAVFRLIDGEIVIEDLTSGDRLRANSSITDSTRWLAEWLEGTWDAEAERMITLDEGEHFLQALIERPMTYWRFEPGEPR